ncbi:MAG: FAD-dependent thymidylate synthase [Thermoguttaceae bacterium]|nr:FAD-dependent thymidylate synthase [Thermoguttaceae bacterium]
MSESDIVNKLRWKKFPVLNDGFVCLVDVMGSDSAVVQAARVSYGDGTRKVSDDRTLLRYLMRHQHTTPFEMAEVKLLIRVPMDSWRQWIRHRTASVNEYSTRYSLAIDSAYEIDSDKWRTQATHNRQGSEGFVDETTGRNLTQEELDFHRAARSLYEHRIQLGIAREQARKDLPLSTYTEAYWKIDLHNLFHFLALRMEVHAQEEIRKYATVIGEKIIQPLFPLSYEAFLDYRFGSLRLSQLDQQEIRLLTQSTTIPASTEDFQKNLIPQWQNLERCRERDECLEKLIRIGIVKPE